MNWTWLGIAAMVLLAASCLMGYRRGFVKEVVSMFCVVLSIAIVWFINPYVNEFIRENTPVYEKIQESCSEYVESKARSRENQSGGQSGMIESLNLPEFLEKGIEQNNNAEVYRYLAVTTFTDYVSGYLARAVVNGFSFLISFLLSTLLIRMITWALNLISKLPVIRGVNKLAGAALGAVKFVIFIWVAFLVLTILCNTAVGKAGLELIEKDTMLGFLYDRNIFIKIFMNIFYGS